MAKLLAQPLLTKYIDFLTNCMIKDAKEKEQPNLYLSKEGHKEEESSGSRNTNTNTNTNTTININQTNTGSTDNRSTNTCSTNTLRKNVNSLLLQSVAILLLFSVRIVWLGFIYIFIDCIFYLRLRPILEMQQLIAPLVPTTQNSLSSFLKVNLYHSQSPYYF